MSREVLWLKYQAELARAERASPRRKREMAKIEAIRARRREDVAAGPPCRCGHGRRAHVHYRHGSGCGLCDCSRWRRRWLPWRKRKQ